MDNWKDIHEEFTNELEEKWKNLGFSWEEAQEWIEKGSLEPTDAGFALFLQENSHTPEKINDILDNLNDLRKEYNKIAKEIGFSFEEEIEEEEIITSKERNWKNIHSDFTPDLVQQWQEKCGFSYEEARDWINIGIRIENAEFCAWLRDVKKINAEETLNQGNIEQLQNEYQQCSLIVQQLHSELPTTYRSGSFSVLCQDYHLGSPKVGSQPFSIWSVLWTLPNYFSGYCIMLFPASPPLAIYPKEYIIILANSSPTWRSWEYSWLVLDK